MYEARFTEKQTLGLHRLTGGNAGEVYTNERTEQVPVIMESGEPSEETRTEYVYDVYQVPDARDPHKVKDAIIEEIHPNGDELKILRKTLAKVLKDTGRYEQADFQEFKQYNEFAEAIDL